MDLRVQEMQDHRSYIQMPKEEMPEGVCHCLRCDYEWMSRTEGKPKACPRCHSYKWDEPREDDK